MENHHHHHRTWPSSSPSSPRFSCRPHLSSPHLSKKPKQKQQQQRKQQNTQSRENPNPNFSSLLPELLLKALSCASARDVAAASGACRSWREALRPLREAAVLHAWGRKYKHGAGHLLANRARAVEHFVKAARLGSAAAMVDAGLMCWEEGSRKEAKDWYVKAAELGHPVGMCNLGLALLEGITWIRL